jgi:hypothetical protein
MDGSCSSHKSQVTSHKAQGTRHKAQIATTKDTKAAFVPSRSSCFWFGASICRTTGLLIAVPPRRTLSPRPFIQSQQRGSRRTACSGCHRRRRHRRRGDRHARCRIRHQKSLITNPNNGRAFPDRKNRRGVATHSDTAAVCGAASSFHRGARILCAAQRAPVGHFQLCRLRAAALQS